MGSFYLNFPLPGNHIVCMCVGVCVCVCLCDVCTKIKIKVTIVVVGPELLQPDPFLESFHEYPNIL